MNSAEATNAHTLDSVLEPSDYATWAEWKCRFHVAVEVVTAIQISAVPNGYGRATFGGGADAHFEFFDFDSAATAHA